VFDLDRKHSLLNLLQAGGLEQLDQVALPGAGVAAALIEGVVAYARERGAPAVEAYPVDPKGGRVDTSFGFVGFTPRFERLSSRCLVMTDAHTDRRRGWLLPSTSADRDRMVHRRAATMG